MVDDDEFEAIVNRDIRGQATQDEADMLRSPGSVKRWRRSLLRMKRRAEYNLSGKTSELAGVRVSLAKDPDAAEKWLKAKAEAATWKQGTLRFRNGIEDKLAEAKDILAQTHPLKEAIERHRQEFDPSDDATAADLELWEMLDE